MDCGTCKDKGTYLMNVGFEIPQATLYCDCAAGLALQALDEDCGVARCEVCNAPVRDGMRFCSGLSPCLFAGWECDAQRKWWRAYLNCGRCHATLAACVCVR